jgi:hypothetical protein
MLVCKARCSEMSVIYLITAVLATDSDPAVAYQKLQTHLLAIQIWLHGRCLATGLYDTIFCIRDKWSLNHNIQYIQIHSCIIMAAIWCWPYNVHIEMFIRAILFVFFLHKQLNSG